MKKSLLVAIIILASLLWAEQKAHAGQILEIISDDPIFSVTNALPGDEYKSEVKVLNHADKKKRFQFELQTNTAPGNLSSQLYFKVLNKRETRCYFGCGKKRSLQSLDNKEIVIRRIPAHKTRAFKFVLTFDENAGNEFQGAATSFDIKLGFKGKRRGRGGDGGGPVGGAAAGLGTLRGALAGMVGGEAIPGEEGIGEALPGEVEGEAAGEEGEVAGEEISLCRGWPLWVWILALIIYFALFLWRTFSKFEEQKKKGEIRWGWQAVLAIAAFLFWYFFDFCREYLWFVILAMIGGAVIYFAYLYLLKRGIRKNYEKVEGPEKEE